MEVADALRAIHRLQGWKFAAAIALGLITSPLWSYPVALFLLFVHLDACQTGPVQSVGAILAVLLAPLWLPLVCVWLLVWGKEY